MEEVLDALYRGRCNVALKAKELGITTEELKEIFRQYVKDRPLDASDPDVWSGDVELSWPWV